MGRNCAHRTDSVHFFQLSSRPPSQFSTFQLFIPPTPTFPFLTSRSQRPCVHRRFPLCQLWSQSTRAPTAAFTTLCGKNLAAARSMSTFSIPFLLHRQSVEGGFMGVQAGPRKESSSTHLILLPPLSYSGMTRQRRKPSMFVASCRPLSMISAANVGNRGLNNSKMTTIRVPSQQRHIPPPKRPSCLSFLCCLPATFARSLKIISKSIHSLATRYYSLN